MVPKMIEQTHGSKSQDDRTIGTRSGPQFERTVKKSMEVVPRMIEQSGQGVVSRMIEQSRRVWK